MLYIRVPELSQFDGSFCGPQNCAAAEGARLVGAAGGPSLTGAAFRDRSGISCVPGVDTESGGLEHSHFVNTLASYGVSIDFPWVRRSLDLIRDRLSVGYIVTAFGDYGYLPLVLRGQKSFTGDHAASLWDWDSASDSVRFGDPIRDESFRTSLASITGYLTHFHDGPGGYYGFVKRREQALLSIERWKAPRSLTGTNVRVFDIDGEVTTLPTLSGQADAWVGIAQAGVPHGSFGAFVRMVTSTMNDADPATWRYVLTSGITLGPEPPSEDAARIAALKATALEARKLVYTARQNAQRAADSAEAARVKLLELARE